MNINFFEQLFQLKYNFLVLFIVFYILSFHWMFIFKRFNLSPYKSVQRVHVDEVSRLGGLVIYIFLWFVWLLDFIKDTFFLNMLISSIPFVLISIKEDLFHNTQPKLRLVSMILSCLIFFYISDINYPEINIPFLGKIISSFPMNIIFFSFCILVF